mmetsp:Transcript_44459/g.72533  ORF Transcript_44459/g.72533 Transcript_44459/m.72533 type:complete len:222 (-) Transcript_44459:588-1253(-)
MPRHDDSRCARAMQEAAKQSGRARHGLPPPLLLLYTHAAASAVGVGGDRGAVLPDGDRFHRHHPRLELAAQVVLPQSVAEHGQVLAVRVLRLRHPRVRQHVRGGGPAGRVQHEHGVDQRLGLGGHVVPERRRVVVPAALDLAEERGVVLVVERGEPAQQDVRDHAHAPHVHLDPVGAALEDLRGHVPRGPARRVHQAVVAQQLGQTEVSDLDDCILTRVTI